MPTINPNETGVQIGIEDSPNTGTVQVTVVVVGTLTDAEATDLADHIAASDLATNRLANTPSKSSVVVQGCELVYP